jgi:hypothetical protein
VLKQSGHSARTLWEQSQLIANTIKCSELLEGWLYHRVAHTLPADYIDDQGSGSEARGVRSQAKDSRKAKVEQGEFDEELSEQEGRLPL